MGEKMQDSEGKTKAVHVRIEGRVQGVWYRGWTVGEASKRGLRGWVRNRSDGSVEAVLAGPERTVNDMLEACWNGPPAARVTGVFHRPAEVTAEAGFSALPTL